MRGERFECCKCPRLMDAASADLVVDTKTDMIYCSECAPDPNEPVGLMGRIGRWFRAWLDHDDDADWERKIPRWRWWIESAALAILVFVLIGVFVVGVK